ncbi:hypothetical protein [Noviherbaspirillum aridicola]|uniref:Uncharacterized protein n=1 Tax=Noviherbaspirillum aridicola TaxID=2849687 RepID=A0ABQ4Q6D9_9BURK|nr:hypothetical protein [Noviherbaspirillum aridicola]GIZ52782.1 hypothetical protein NCCP691_27960 [Noviherbaspirillum aridicola]
MRTTSTALLMACAALQGCTPGALDSRQSIAGGLESEMRETRRLIEREVGDASAQRPEQCRVLPLGARACGGPQAYLVYSTARADERRLQELARQYTEAEQKYNRIAGTMSTCSHIEPPQVRLQHGRCTARSTHDDR